MKIIIVGGGPAGMAAAIAASSGDTTNEVHIYEKNEKLGKKLFITGKGRCNITNCADMRTVMDNVVSNPKFMFSAFRIFTNQDIVNLIEEGGCPTKEERGNRVFPVSDHSNDVIRSLERTLRKNNVHIHLNEEVRGLIINDGVCQGINLKGNRKENADKVIIATGAVSYPSTGSTGDGYRWAVYAGHKIVETVPALVPLEAKVGSIPSGLSLKNVRGDILDGSKLLYSEFGEMLFTHFGVSGPIILSASSYITRKLKERKLKLVVDLKPALDEATLDQRVIRDFDKNKNKALKNSLSELLLSGLIDQVISQAGLDPNKKVNELTKQERLKLVQTVKGLSFDLTGTRGFNEAIITQGGVSTREIDPKTMESKLVKNLFFAGEIIDVDALTGGFNLQIAWSTGYTAGRS